MSCPECGRALFTYEPGVVTCKAGHRWYENKDAPRPSTGHLVPTEPLPARERVRVLPAWVPGAALGGVALVVELVRWVA